IASYCQGIHQMPLKRLIHHTQGQARRTITQHVPDDLLQHPMLRKKAPGAAPDQKNLFTMSKNEDSSQPESCQVIDPQIGSKRKSSRT
ncbi:hypothetical protein, partial [Telmatospirillum sp. J64-1]|uniref:hypothetical protein n=1 Tax=Telmatospirillum sp. J64-1 TaxID=2502183 RepID=UPI001C8F2253